VAQQFPRDLDRVRRDVAEVCGHLELAQRAAYAVQNRGQGHSIHLARALAVAWGNLDYGVHELRRDDAAGMSEVQAFAWDMQRNSRATRTFQVPHAVMRGNKRVPIDDLTDVYRNNQNVGARAVRECILGVIPDDLVEYAARLCRETVQRGDGKPIEQRRVEAVAAFERFRVTRAQLEQRIGRPVDHWTAEDVASLVVVWQSINAGEATVGEQFDEGPARVTVAELGSGDPVANEPREHAPEPVGDQRPATGPQIQRLVLMLRDLDVDDDDAQRAWLSRELGRPVESRKTLTRAEASTCMDVLGVLIAERDAEQTGGGDA
jgi:hypothetical protein